VRGGTTKRGFEREKGRVSGVFLKRNDYFFNNYLLALQQFLKKVLFSKSVEFESF